MRDITTPLFWPVRVWFAWDWIIALGKGFLSDRICPAIGQGALAVEVRCDDRLTLDRVRTLDDRDSRRAVEAERSLLNGLGGGCQVPIAGLATVDGAHLQLIGLVGAADGSRLIRESGQSTVEEPLRLGRSVAQRLLDRGAAELLQMTG